MAAGAAPAASTVVYAYYDWHSPSEQSITTMGLGGGTTRELVAGEGLRRSPSWSRDGRRIAYVAAGALGDPTTIVIMASDGRDSQAIPLDNVENVYHADWSPDGGKLVFIAHEPGQDSGGRLSLYSITVATGVVTRLTDGAADTHPSWSPDGEWIVFGSGGHLDVIDADGGQRRRIRPGRVRFVPAWSPDGSTIAYIRGDHDIRRVSPDGDERETVAVFPEARLGDLSWYPTGNALLFTSTVGGVRRISRVDIDGSNVRTIAETREGRFGRPRLFIPTLGGRRRWLEPHLWGGVKQSVVAR